MKRAALFGLTLAALGGGVTAFALLRGPTSEGNPTVAPPHADAGETVASDARVAAAFPCARGRLAAAQDSVELGTPPRYVLRGPVLDGAPGTGSTKRVSIGVVADARGPTAPTLVQLRALAKKFETRKVSVVVSLGGMGRDARDIERALLALTEGHTWLVVAIPGDREAVSGHRAAVSALRAAGHLVVDGSQVRLLHLGGATLGTFPGVARREQLIAGDQGCRHDKQDATALATALTASPGPRIWLGHAPARQRGAAASDVAIGGIHVGEQVITDAIAARGIALVVHGLVDEAAVSRRSGSWKTGQPTAHVAAGAAESIPVTGARGSTIRGAALVVDVQAGRLRWQPLRL